MEHPAPDVRSNKIVPRRLKSYGEIFEADTDGIAVAQHTARGDHTATVGNNFMWSLAFAGKNWKKNRDKVWQEVQRSGYYAATVALFGTCFAIAQNELIFREFEPNCSALFLLKLGNTICSFLAMACVYRIQWIQILLERLRDHIDRGLLLQTQVTVGDVFATSWTLWIELIVVGIHLPPGCTFEFGTTTLDNYVVYRSETLFCLWNTLRLYLLWRVVRDRTLDHIPQLFTIAHYTEVKLGSSYVTKRLLKSWASIFYIAAIWAGVILLAAYWFRAMENTACLLKTTVDPYCQHRNAKIWALQEGDEFEKVNDIYMWNHIWLIFIVSTKGNNGMFRPTTHSSRFVAACASTFGIVLTSFLTASLAQALSFNPQEDSTNLVIRRERARTDLKIQAVNMISRWFRVKTRRPLSKKQRGMLRSDMIKRFMETRRQAMGDLDDLLGASDKIDKLNLRTKRMEFALYHLAQEHNVDKVTEFYSIQDQHRSNAAPHVPARGDADIDKHSVQETVSRMRRGSIGSICDGTVEGVPGYSPKRAVHAARSPVTRRNSAEDLLFPNEAEDSSSGRRTVPRALPQREAAEQTQRKLLPPQSVEPAGASDVHPFASEEEPKVREEVLEPGTKSGRFLGDISPGSLNGSSHRRASADGASEAVMRRLTELEANTRAVQAAQDERMGRMEAHLAQIQLSQRESASQILAALQALAGTRTTS